MSDSSDQDELQTVNLDVKAPQKERKKRVLSEEAKIKMRENLSLARAKRAQTKNDQLATLTEEKSLLKELLEEKKKSKAMLAAKKKPVKKKVKEKELSSESETESESESDSSEEESEFVLSQRASKTSSKTSSKKALREKLLAAELALAKRKKHSKVNVYVGHPEPKMPDQAKRQILDL